MPKRCMKGKSRSIDSEINHAASLHESIFHSQLWFMSCKHRLTKPVFFQAAPETIASAK